MLSLNIGSFAMREVGRFSKQREGGMPEKLWGSS